MQAGYHSVMNYDRQFDYFNYSEKPYFADTPAGKVLVPADWDSLVLDNPRIGAYAESIGARVTAPVEAEKVEEDIEIETPAPVEVAEPEVPAEIEAEVAEVDEAEEAEAQPGVVPAEQPKAEQKVEAKAKAEAPKQANNQVNVAAIIGGVVAALAALGIGAAFLAMR